MKKITVVIILVLIHTSLCAATMDEWIEQYRSKKKIPGLAVLVVQDGKTRAAKGYGLANVEHNVPVKAETIFQSGSIGKQFTATAVMMLVEQNKLQVSDPISKYLNVPDSWKGITIRHMLTHTSGLGDYPESFSLQRDYTEEELLSMITAQPLLFSPGEKWNYSNLAYVTLGILIHKVTGEFYGDFLQKHIFRPAGMRTARIIDETDIIPNRAAGYRLVNGELKNQEWVSPTLNTTADGSLYFSIKDLAKWDQALKGETLLKKSSLNEMWTPVMLNSGAKEPYGYGWMISKTKAGKQTIEHGGAWQGFTSHIARYPENNLTVATLCNLAGCDATYIAHRVAGFFDPELSPTTYQAVSLQPGVLKSYEGDYRLEDRLTLKVTSSGTTLSTEMMGEKMELIPYGGNTFFVEDSERTFEFVKDRNGKTTKMILRLPMELVFDRIEITDDH
jgi:CubicO group peptidase (beta-lactamase class C family)